MGAKDCTKSEAEIKYVRRAVKALIEEGKATVADLARVVGRDRGNFSRFCNGRQGLNDTGIEALYASSLVERYRGEEVSAMPLDGWWGELRSVKEVAHDKGYSEQTVRKYCRGGRLSFVRRGRRIWVAVDEKYGALPQTRLGALRSRVVELERENERLKRRLESHQEEFDFGEAKEEKEGVAVVEAAGTPLSSIIMEVGGDDGQFEAGDVVEVDVVNSASAASMDMPSADLGVVDDLSDGDGEFFSVRFNGKRLRTWRMSPVWEGGAVRVLEINGDIKKAKLFLEEEKWLALVVNNATREIELTQEVCDRLVKITGEVL